MPGPAPLAAPRACPEMEEGSVTPVPAVPAWNAVLGVSVVAMFVMGSSLAAVPASGPALCSLMLLRLAMSGSRRKILRGTQEVLQRSATL